MLRAAGYAFAIALVIAMTIALGGPTAAVATEYRMSDYRAPTPETVPGAQTVNAAELHKLADQGNAVLIDVYPAPPRPAGLPADAVWLPKARHSIAGAVWLPNVGYGALSDELDHYFRTNLERLTGGHHDRPLAFFCELDCWMSWNAALRAVEYGYTAVYYFPDGVQGWTIEGLALADLQPVPIR